MVTAVQKRKKKPTHRHYRAEFPGSISPKWDALEQYRRKHDWPENGAWLRDRNECIRIERVLDRLAYEAIWAVPIKPAASSGVRRG